MTIFNGLTFCAIIVASALTSYAFFPAEFRQLCRDFLSLFGVRRG